MFLDCNVINKHNDRSYTLSIGYRKIKLKYTKIMEVKNMSQKVEKLGMKNVKCCNEPMELIMGVEYKDNLYACSNCGQQVLEPNGYYEI